MDEYPSKHYNFFRRDTFYTLELESDSEAIEKAEATLGTIRVEDIEGNVVWPIEH